jgi:large subunit ribosomal protein L10
MNQKILSQKSAIIEEIKTKITSSSSLLIVKYQGTTVLDVEKLRNTLKENEVSYTVYKNTLVERAFKETGITFPHELSGPNAFIFTTGSDGTKGIRLVDKFTTDNPKIVITEGLLEGKYVDQATILQLAKLPDRSGLLSMFLSCLQHPIRKFAATVKALSEAKGG